LPDLPPQIFQKWNHSFEEDSPDATVYRPPQFNFPRARGRAGIEFSPDGKFVEWAIGRGDAQQAIPGRWVAEGPNRVRVSFEQGSRAPRSMEILECSADVLKMKK
jgi:hypothetical protein